nr:hypothetical protein [uncultured Albidiferax sp.]
MTQPLYMAEPWFALMQAACAASSRKEVAVALAVSPPVVSQVLNATGKYGAGLAKTDKLAERVLHTYGRYPCPHLTEQSATPAEPVVVTADECRAYAHRPAPAGSPRDMQHWQACLQCPHKGHTAAPVAKPPQAPRPRVLQIHRNEE